MDVENVQLTNFYYQGRDDCITIKPRSYNVDVHNVTCHGGNGIAIGSLGQYLEDSSAANIRVKVRPILSASLLTTHTINRSSHTMTTCTTVRTSRPGWGGQVPQTSYESAGKPNGGGWGSVRNILFSNFELYSAGMGPAINQDSGDNGSYAGTSKMSVSNIAFVNFTGYLDRDSDVVSEVSCSNVHLCYNIDFDNVVLYPTENSTTPGTGTCQYTADGGVHGLDGC